MYALQNIKIQNYSTKNIHRVLILTKQFVQTCMSALQNIKKNYLTKNIHRVLILTKQFVQTCMYVLQNIKNKIIQSKISTEF
jgi:hypothetical protein